MEDNKRKREEEEEEEEENKRKREEEDKEERIRVEAEAVSKEVYMAVKKKDRDALRALCLKWKIPEYDGDLTPYRYFDEYKDKHQRDAIMLATKKNDLESIAMLLDAGVTYDNKDVEGNTILMIAAENNHIEALKMIAKKLSGSMYIDERQAWDEDHEGECPTALHIAAYQGNAECCRVLVEAGADIDAIHHASSALIIAAKEGEHETVEVLLELGANTEDFEEADWPARLLKMKEGKGEEDDEEEDEEEDEDN